MKSGLQRYSSWETNDPPGPSVGTTEDDETEKYNGFFTVHRSADFMLKICFTLVSFVFILILTSLHITRKKYRLPSIFRSSKIRQSSGVFKIDSLSPQLPAISAGESLGVKCPSGLLILHRMLLQNLKLPIQIYSCAPGWLRDESYGLLFSRASQERRILAHLVDYAFHDIPSAYVESVVRQEFEALLTGNLNFIDDHYFDKVARRCIMRLVLNVNCSDDPENLARVREISRILDDLKKIHYGTIRLSVWNRFSSYFGVINPARNGLTDIKKLMEAPIRYEMNTMTETIPEEANFLQTFIAARMELEEEGDQTGFLTVAHLAHAAVDCQLIVEEILTPAFRWTLLILGHRPLMAEELRQELKQFDGRTGPRSRAFALELVRWTQVGSQLGASQLLDDWRMSQIDYPIQSVLMYDMKSVANDPEIWGDPETFRPERFEMTQVSRSGWSARVDAREYAVNALLDASGWGVFVPIEFLLHMIAAGALHIAGQLRVRVDGNEDLKAAPHSLSRLPAPFSFRIREH